MVLVASRAMAETSGRPSPGGPSPWHPKHFFSGLLEAEQGRDFLVGGKAIEAQLREDELAVDRDLETAARALHQLHLEAGDHFLQFGGQTGRLGQVVSHAAVLDSGVHYRSRSRRWSGRMGRESATLRALARRHTPFSGKS